MSAVTIILVIAAVTASAQQPPEPTPQLVFTDTPGSAVIGGGVTRGSAALEVPGLRPSAGADAGTFRVKVIFWNDSQQLQPAGAVVTLGGRAFRPDPAKPEDSETLGPLPRGVTLDLLVEPDGTRGKQIVTPVRFTAGMVSGSARDAINVDVTDSAIRIVGNPLEKYDVTVRR